MTGQLRDLTRDLHGNYILTLQVNGDARAIWDELNGCEIDVDIKKHRRHRSLDANGFAWALIGKIAAKAGVDRAQVYRDAIRTIGGTSTVICVPSKAVETLCEGWSSRGVGWQAETMPSKLNGCTNVILYYGSSVYDTKQMSLLIDHLVQDAKALGIETLTPHELETMMNGYERKCSGQ